MDFDQRSRNMERSHQCAFVHLAPAHRGSSLCDERQRPAKRFWAGYRHHNDQSKLQHFVLLRLWLRIDNNRNCQHTLDHLDSDRAAEPRTAGDVCDSQPGQRNLSAADAVFSLPQ
jgi:hypothetical protein